VYYEFLGFLFLQYSIVGNLGEPSFREVSTCPLLILLRRMSFICFSVYRGPHILKYVLIARIHHLAFSFLPEKSSRRLAFTSTRAVVVDMSLSLSRKISDHSEPLSESEGLGLGGSRERLQALAKAHWKA